MPPKASKKAAVTKQNAPVVVELPPAGYDPSTHQLFLKAGEWFSAASQSEVVALGAVDAALQGVASHIQTQKLMSLVVPYTIEAGLAVSLEPSLLYNFTQDDKGFHYDTEFERDEPPLHQKDFFCIDKAKGPEKLAKRYIYPVEEDKASNASEKKSTRYSPLGRGLARRPTRVMSSTRNQLDFKIKDMTKDKESTKNIVGIIKSRGQS